MKLDIKGRNFLLLGGSGFIGQHLCKVLVDKGANVISFDRTEPNSVILRDQHSKVEWIKGDFNHIESIKEQILKSDYIYHLISTTVPFTSNQNIEYDLSSNVLTTIRLLNMLRESSLHKLIFLSSGGTVYGIQDSFPIKEDVEKNPICGYGIHKLTIEKYLYYHNWHHNLRYCVLRLANPYGFAQISNRPQGIIGNYIFKILNNQPLEIWGDGSIIRDYIYIDDAIEALILALDSRINAQTMNIGTGNGSTIIDIISQIEELHDSKIEKVFKSQHVMDVPVNILDISAAQRNLNWKPKITLKDGITKMYQFAKDNLFPDE